MAPTPAAVRLGLWRVTRHPTVRQLYDSLEARELFLAQLDRFERETEGTEPVAVPEGVILSVTTAAEGVPDRLAGDPLAPGDRLVRARRETTVGSCVVSDRAVYVPELGRRLSFDGAYLWRLYVAPAERGRGIGTAIVARTVAAAATAGADRIVALVAPDNLPSRRAFRSLGFRPTERFTGVGCGGYRCHRRRPLPEGAPD